MNSADPYSYLLTFHPDITDNFSALVASMKLHAATPKLELPTFSPTTSIDDAVSSLETCLASVKRAEVTRKNFLSAINQTIASLKDINFLLTETKRQCISDGLKNDAFNDSVVDALIQKERQRYEEEVKTNVFRKAQLEMIYLQKETALSEKRVSHLPFKSEDSKLDALVKTDDLENPDLNDFSIPLELDKAELSSVSQSSKKVDFKKFDKIEKIEALEKVAKRRPRRLSANVNRKPRELKTTSAYDNSLISVEHRQQITAWCSKCVGDVIFDSNIDAIGKGSKAFNQRVFHRENGIALFIFDDEKNIFGCVVTKSIESEDITVEDENAFVFSLMRNGEKCAKKFMIKKEEAKNAIFVGKKMNVGLFSVGNDDIRINRKFHENTVSFCAQNAFDYGEEKEALCGKVIPNYFALQRLVIAELK
ncbi:hypothetical protein EIN_166110 [Entamoeba invadens IP1]|uniref:TLDc domain-containing protein n=1 Tax=Entamoeba invadens IP1 TaxID=370355 RepID=A0A0A1UGE8_ENTIV|nr:hypothetical protein EIN_166110 [Entamoeba invadens IP1]ELP92606.1 hypothetical protein EIN_166110 [Entamoeba invadens IP1]|eukprot:XP_004259377.1 hypothetical protein EIN_166110 [Entamoeba invadens IP1]